MLEFLIADKKKETSLGVAQVFFPPLTSSITSRCSEKEPALIDRSRLILKKKKEERVLVLQSKLSLRTLW